MRFTAACLWVIVVALVASTGRAATIFVETRSPFAWPDGRCAFVEAVDNANHGDVHPDCVAGDPGLDRIELGDGEDYDIADLHLADDVIVNGNGSRLLVAAGHTGLTISDAVVALSDLTIRGRPLFGKEGTALAATRSWLVLDRFTVKLTILGVEATDSSLVISDSLFSNNVTALRLHCGTVEIVDSELVASPVELDEAGFAPACSVDAAVTGSNLDQSVISMQGAGSLSVRDSWVTGAVHAQGVNPAAITVRRGLSDDAETVLVIDRCTLSDNATAALFLGSGVKTTIVASTISHNLEPDLGANILVEPAPIPALTEATVRDTTIVGATFDRQSNVFAHTTAVPDQLQTRRSRVVFENSVLSSGGGDSCATATTVDGMHPYVNLQAEWVSNGFNLADDDSCNLDQTTDEVALDVMLSRLEDWGGPTRTHMPLEGSPAIDTGTGRCAALDQRGYARPVDGDDDGIADCDRGAVEAASASPTTRDQPFEPDAPGD